MPTLREYFVSESNDYFTQLNELLNRLDTSSGDPTELMRLARALRGSAQLARETRVYRAGIGLEAAARAVSVGAFQWSADLSDRARRTIEDMKALAAGGETDDAADARVKRVLDRWRQAGVPLPDDMMQTASAERSAASKQFREFAAHESAGIAAEIDAALTELTRDPRNRDALKAILRRQRALTGAARLDEISVVAETLRAIEDLVRVIHKLNVAVKEEWAAVLRAAREVLVSALEPLKQGQDPKPTPALSKLRTLRTELLERYGEGEAVNVSANTPPKDPMSAVLPAAAQMVAGSTPPASAPTAPAAPAAPSNGDDSGDRIVPIEELCYSGERALRRALELRPRMESLCGDDSDKQESVEELFDLIRLGIG